MPELRKLSYPERSIRAQQKNHARWQKGRKTYAAMVSRSKKIAGAVDSSMKKRFNLKHPTGWRTT